MKLSNQNILIVSNEKWGDVWYSKHNWANELSKNNKVYFINPPEKWRLKNFFSTDIRIYNYSENLKVLSYSNRLPLTRFNLFYRINDHFILLTLKKWFKKNKIDNFIFWTFDPYRFSTPKLLRPLFSIYFIADKYTIKREYLLIKNVNYYISVSPELIDKHGIENPLILSHGISSSEFDSDSDIEIEANYILYIGNIDYRLDYKYIKQMLENFPNERFLFIGKINAPSNDSLFNELFIEKKFRNLIYHQPIHFKKLKNYISKSKICIAPMKLDVNGNNINHHKLLQYLAHGKPVVSAQFKDYNNNNVLYSYQSNQEGIKHIQNLTTFKEEGAYSESRISFAKQYLYDNLIEKIENHISKNGDR